MTTRAPLRSGVDTGDLERGPLERASPGLGALFAGMREGGGHVVLDLGPARPAHLRILSPFLGQLRFAELIQGATGSPAEAIRDLPGNPDGPYDVVLAWDVLDRLGAEERRHLIARLAELTAPRARIFFLVAASSAPRPASTFLLGEPGRLIQTETGPVLPAAPELLPAAVERLLGPFEVQHAFYVRSGWREYVAVKRR